MTNNHARTSHGLRLMKTNHGNIEVRFPYGCVFLLQIWRNVAAGNKWGTPTFVSVPIKQWDFKLHTLRLHFLYLYCFYYRIVLWDEYSWAIQQQWRSIGWRPSRVSFVVESISRTVWPFQYSQYSICKRTKHPMDKSLARQTYFEYRSWYVIGTVSVVGTRTSS